MTQDGASVLGYPVVNEASNETHNFSIDANLSSNAALGDTVSTSFPVYDALGQSHLLTVNFTSVGVNTWNYSISLPASEEVTAPVVNTKPSHRSRSCFPTGLKADEPGKPPMWTGSMTI